MEVSNNSNLNSNENIPEKKLEKKPQRLDLINEMEFVKTSAKDNSEYGMPLDKSLLSNIHLEKQIDNLQISDENKKIIQNLVSNLDFKKHVTKDKEYAKPLQKDSNEFVFSNTYTQEQKDKFQINDETKKILDKLIEIEKKPLNKNKI